MRTALFSIISPNYRHFARVLMESAHQIHPEWDRFVLVVGNVGNASSSSPGQEPFTEVTLEALRLPHPRRFSFRYTLLEMNTAVKPWMFEYLFERGYDRVLYLDPDVAIYSRLEELDAAGPETFLTLTPHLTGPIDGDEHHPNQRSMLIAGIYNLGFLAVSRQPQLESFLAWWKGKLEYQCLVDTERGLFVDQKWMDLAPGMFGGVSILRHEGYNVAYWNLRQRTVTGVGAAVATVNGQPLRFFHYSGFDPAVPDMVSRHDHRTRVVDCGDAEELFDDYVAALHAAGYESFRDEPYPFSVFADGTLIKDTMRVAYRNSKLLQSACGSDPFAHPELFSEVSEPPPVVRSLGIGAASYKVLSRVRLIVRFIPRPLRARMRAMLLGDADWARPAANRRH